MSYLQQAFINKFNNNHCCQFLLKILKMRNSPDNSNLVFDITVFSEFIDTVTSACIILMDHMKYLKLLVFLRHIISWIFFFFGILQIECWGCAWLKCFNYKEI